MLEQPHNLKTIVEAIEIPDTYYDLARERYRTIGEHLVRDKSTVRLFEPDVHSQGSFRLGTAIRPLGEAEEYDVDLVCTLRLLTKEDVTQEELRQLIRGELDDYVARNAMKAPPRDRPRCITLDYSGTPSFHVDVLPCIPEDGVTVQGLAADWAIPIEWAELAIAITDKNDPKYREKDTDWPSSNPDAYGRWFVDRMSRTAAFREAKGLAELPVYKRKLPLQRVVQLLKRHACNFFADEPRYRPISMLITTLSAKLYQGERSIEEAFFNIVPQLPTAVSSSNPSVPNPVNPLENFADKWVADSNYYHAYQDWCDQLNRDLADLSGIDRSKRENVAERGFKAKPRGSSVAMPHVHIAPTPISSPQGEKPWRTF